MSISTVSRELHQQWYCSSDEVLNAIKNDSTSQDGNAGDVLPLFVRVVGVDQNTGVVQQDTVIPELSHVENEDRQKEILNNNNNNSPFEPSLFTPAGRSTPSFRGAKANGKNNEERTLLELRFASRFIITIDDYTDGELREENDEEGMEGIRRVCFGDRHNLPSLLKRVHDGQIIVPTETVYPTTEGHCNDKIDNDIKNDDEMTVGELLLSNMHGVDECDESHSNRVAKATSYSFIILHDCCGGGGGGESFFRRTFNPPCMEINYNASHRYRISNFLEVHADVLAVVRPNDSALMVLQNVRDRIVRQILAGRKKARESRRSRKEVDDVEALPLYRCCHFRPWGLSNGPSLSTGYLLTRQWTSEVGNDNVQKLVFADQESSPDLIKQRQALHEIFSLPLDRPLLRTSQALPDLLDPNDHQSSNSSHLVDVHIGVPPSNVPGASEYLVDGSYRYYHYMQDNVDDTHWGCAYRSLQTLHSWFELNGYTTKHAPTHREIQQCLVDIGDKPSTIVDSKEWIGSVEVGYVLNEQLGIDCKYVFVPSGPNIADKARDIAHHFKTQGIPIMMGGGNLAFTILGIAWNDGTGECRFLVLDPHYTGPDDLMIIQRKRVTMSGYRETACGWRSASSFSSNSFYQLCLPQRPKLI